MQLHFKVETPLDNLDGTNWWGSEVPLGFPAGQSD